MPNEEPPPPIVPAPDDHDAAVMPHGLGEPTDRRTFLARASALSLAVPSVGAALAACGPAGSGGTADSTARRRASAAPAATL